MVLQTEIKANIVASVDKQSFNDWVTYARDTKKKLDQDLKAKLELDVATFQVQLDQARARLRAAKKENDQQAIIKAQLETNELQRWLTEAKRQLNNYVNTGDKDLSRLQAKFNWLWDSAKKAISDFGKTILWWALAFGIQRTADAVITLAGNLEQARIAFTTLTGSASQADVLLKDLADFAKSTPFELTGLREQSKLLLAYWFEVDDIIPTLEALGNISAWVGTDKLPRLTYALWQVRAAGKLTGQDFRQFTETGVSLWEELQKITGITEKITSANVAELWITYAQVQQALQNLWWETWRFWGLMEAQSQTLQWSLSNLKDSLNILGEEVGSVFIPVLSKLVQSILPIVTKFWEFAEESPKTASAIASITAALWLLVSAFVVLWWPVTLLIGGIWLLTAATASFISVIWWGRNTISQVNTTLWELKSKIDDNKKSQEELDTAFKNGTISLIEYNKKTQELEEELKKLEKEAWSAVLSLEDIRKEYDKINANWITTEQEREQLKLLRDEAIRTRNSLNDLVVQIQENFKKSKKIVEKQRKETEAGARALAWAWAEAWFAWQQLLFDLAQLNQTTNELQGVENVINYIWLALWDTAKTSETTASSVTKWAWISKKWLDEVAEAAKFVQKEQEWIEKLMKKTAEETAKKLQENWQAAFDAITDAIKDSEKAVVSLKKELEGIDAELASVEQDIWKRALKIEKELSDINIKIASGDATEEDIQKRIALEQELALATANINAELLATLREEEAKSETQKLLDRQTALQVRQAELIAEIEFEEKLQADLTKTKEEFERQITETHKIELKKQETATRAYANNVIQMYREIEAAARAAAAAGGMWGGGSIPWRAIWWPVGAGSPYIVGERWPELFVPQQSGNIVPNNEINNNITVNANVSNDIDLDILGNTLAQKIALSRKGIF